MNKLFNENWAYYRGDHFQFWNGAKLPRNHPKYSHIQEEIKKIFRSYNICSEIVDTYVNTLVGKPFTYYLKNKQDANDLRVEELVSKWLDWQSETAIDQDFGDPIATATTYMLATGIGYLRLYTPKIYSKLPIERQIVLHAPNPTNVETSHNNEGILERAIYHFGDNQKEIYTLLRNGLTKIESERDGVKTVNLGGRLPIVELRGKCLINDAIKRAQNGINKTLTIKDKNIESAGFLERVILGGLPPGKWIEDENGNDRFIPNNQRLEIGINKTTYISGIPIGDVHSPKGYTNPKISYRQPISIDNFNESLKLDVSTIYHQAGLAYILTANDGRISARSRIALKEDFLVRLGIYERIIEAGLRRVFSIVLATLTDNKTNLKAVVELNLGIIPNPEEREQNRLDVKKGIMSRNRAISYLGINPEKELYLIEQESA